MIVMINKINNCILYSINNYRIKTTICFHIPLDKCWDKVVHPWNDAGRKEGNLVMCEYDDGHYYPPPKIGYWLDSVLRRIGNISAI